MTLTDYASYTPSYEAPASFIASQISNNEKTVAVAFFQMPIDRLTNIMKNREGLGETGESYLVGVDKLLRSDSYHDAYNRSVNTAFRAPENGRMEYAAINAGLSGRTNVEVIDNYLGTEVISSYLPVTILNHRWVLVAEIYESEVFAAVDNMFLCIIVSGLLIGLTSILIGWYTGSKLVNGIERNVNDLLLETEQLESAVDSMKTQTETLIDNVVRSATAVQETASSISEINSTLQANT